MEAHKRNTQATYLNKDEIQALKEHEVYRKQGEKVEDALYRDYLKRSARNKLIKESVSGSSWWEEYRMYIKKRWTSKLGSL